MLEDNGRPDILWLDPAYSFQSSGISDTDQARVRDVLSGLIGLAARTSTTVIGNMHTNRSQGMDLRSVAANSMAWVRMARSVLLLGKARDDEDDQTSLVFAYGNYVLGGSPPSKRLYFSGPVQVTHADGRPYLDDAGEPVFENRLDIGEDTTAVVDDQLLTRADIQGRISATKDSRSKVEKLAIEVAQQWIKDGRVNPAKGSQFGMLTEGHSGSTKTAMRKKLGIRTESIQNEKGQVDHVVWHFPANIEERVDLSWRSRLAHAVVE
jgi:hypothetical protein